MDASSQLNIVQVVERQLLDRLLQDSKLFTSSKDFKALVDFVAKLKDFAPFNAMLLQVQKKGLTYAATQHDWKKRFGRTVKEGARPLLIMWPFGPVALVYDVMDTEGPELPKYVESFHARGPVTRGEIEAYGRSLWSMRIEYGEVDEGDGSAGRIKLLERAGSKNAYSRYKLFVNRNHRPATQFATLVHELGHLYLGHLGKDPKLGIPERSGLMHAQRELEAETVSYLVCKRYGIESAAESYLNDYVNDHTTVEDIELYQVMRAVGQVEKLLGIADRSTVVDLRS